MIKAGAVENSVSKSIGTCVGRAIALRNCRRQRARAIFELTREASWAVYQWVRLHCLEHAADLLLDSMFMATSVRYYCHLRRASPTKYAPPKHWSIKHVPSDFSESWTPRPTRGPASRDLHIVLFPLYFSIVSTA